MDYISSMPSEQWQQSTKYLTILGSTGSIGRSTLNVIRKNPENIHILALGAGKNLTLLAEQACEFRPPILAIKEEEDIESLRNLLPESYSPIIVYGKEGYSYIASLPEVNTVLCAQVGASGLHGTYSAVSHGKVVALANKESLVLAGRLLRNTARNTGASILPVDSEHSALLQLSSTHSSIVKLILTASGGPFRGKSKSDLQKVTVHDALQHPTWNMGAKITIDSATMMNKGLEVIEAYHLFGIAEDCIDAIIHPQSIIHALIALEDSTHIAHASYPSMELAIAYALYYPIGRPVGLPMLSLLETHSLTFEPITDIYRCYYLAREALQESNEAPIILNSANEIAVESFLSGSITFIDIADIVEHVMHTLPAPQECSSIEDILMLDERTRTYTEQYIKERYR